MSFQLLPPDQQRQAIKRLSLLGWSENTISATTGLHVEQIRKVISEGQADAFDVSPKADTSPAPISSPTSPRCPRTGVPMAHCTCIGPHEARA